MSFHKQVKSSDGPQIISADKVKFHPPTGISVLVVGAGVGGVMAALECRRKGHSVRLVERAPSPSTAGKFPCHVWHTICATPLHYIYRTESSPLGPAGDFFSIGANVIRHFYDFWPDLAAELKRINYEGWVAYHKITGERVSGPEPPMLGDLKFDLADGTKKTIPFNRHNRPKFIAALLAQVAGVGVDITYGKRVVDYFEDHETNKAGVIFEDGGRLDADVVIAADGVGTKSNKLVNGHDIRAYPSGFSIFRTAFPIEIAMADPEIRERWPLLEGGRPYVELWGG